MPVKKLGRKRRLRKNFVEDARFEETSAGQARRDAISRNRELVVNEMSEILARRRADRAARRDAARDARLKLYETELRNRGKTAQEEKMAQIRRDMKSVLVAGVEKVNALKVIGEKVKLDGSTMTIGRSKYKLRGNVHMVGWGRETPMLGAAFEKLIGNHLKRGFLVVPGGSISAMWDNPLWFPALNTRITYLEGGSAGSADERSVAATRRVADHCKRLRRADILVVILSSGAEALLSCPKAGIASNELDELVHRLGRAGATPAEITAVRRKLSAVLGGELARLAYPARVVTLAMSDVPGDRAHLIAGAPTVNDPGRDAASAILRRYRMDGAVPPGVALALGEAPPADDPLVDEVKRFNFVDYHVVASASDAVRAMADAAFRLGLVPVVLSSAVVGSVRDVSRAYARTAALMILAAEGKIDKLEMYDAMRLDRVLPLSEEQVSGIFPSKDKWGLGLCLLLGGAPTCEEATGRPGNETGPNQELALHFSLDWYLKVKENPVLRDYVVWFLGGNTSGVDGNGRAAGAYGYGDLGPAVFKRYKRLAEEEAALALSVSGLLRKDPESGEAREALERRDAVRDELARVSAILPDRVLRERNANSFFASVNDGDELLDLGHTCTAVRDLHVIRIARYQCSCDGRCPERTEKGTRHGTVCRDTKCVANETPPALTTPRETRCCARPAGLKVEIF